MEVSVTAEVAGSSPVVPAINPIEPAVYGLYHVASKSLTVRNGTQVCETAISVPLRFGNCSTVPINFLYGFGPLTINGIRAFTLIRHSPHDPRS
jgi:hypothetical protein